MRGVVAEGLAVGHVVEYEDVAALAHDLLRGQFRSGGLGTSRFSCESDDRLALTAVGNKTGEDVGVLHKLDCQSGVAVLLHFVAGCLSWTVVRNSGSHDDDVSFCCLFTAHAFQLGGGFDFANVNARRQGLKNRRIDIRRSQNNLGSKTVSGRGKSSTLFTR